MLCIAIYSFEISLREGIHKNNVARFYCVRRMEGVVHVEALPWDGFGLLVEHMCP